MALTDDNKSKLYWNAQIPRVKTNTDCETQRVKADGEHKEGVRCAREGMAVCITLGLFLYPRL